MKYLLDTDIIIYHLRGDTNVVANFSRCKDEDVALSLITYAEICVGINYQDPRSEERKLNKKFLEEFEVVDLTKRTAFLFGQCKAKLSKRGEKIADLDLLNACVAFENGLIMVTDNIRHFERIEGLKIQNWKNGVVA